MSGAVSTGDWIAFGALAVNAIGYVGLIRLGRRDHQRQDRDEEREDAAREAASEFTLKELKVGLDKLATSQDAANAQYREHELTCTKRWAQYDTRQEQIVSTLDKVGRNVEQLQSQMRFVAAGSHDRAVEMKA